MNRSWSAASITALQHVHMCEQILVYNFCLSIAARTYVWTNPNLQLLSQYCSTYTFMNRSWSAASITALQHVHMCEQILVYNFCLSIAARTYVWTNPNLQLLSQYCSTYTFMNRSWSAASITALQHVHMCEQILVYNFCLSIATRTHVWTAPPWYTLCKLLGR